MASMRAWRFAVPVGAIARDRTGSIWASFHDELRFDGRVAVVTGAGRGIGRAHAELLAARGACVVVNDLGTSVGGDGVDAAPAEAVAAAIEAAGGTAVADATDVSTEAGGAELIATAVERFGRIDVVVGNAGIMRWAGLPELDLASIERHLAVHLGGSFSTAKAAWPHMVEQGYGRIVMTTSAGVFGHAENIAYATAKGAVIGLARCLGVAGAPHGIKANLVAPAAVTRMAGVDADAPPDAPMAPELVAPMVAVLAHESCPVTGEIYAAGAGRFSRVVLAMTQGYVHTDGAPTPEDVAGAWGSIHDDRIALIPADLDAWSAWFTAHLRRERGARA